MKKNFKKFRKKSGTLIPFSYKKDFPIKSKRVFFISGKKNFIRGDHAHKKCSQYLIPLLGKIQITLINKKGKRVFNLNANNSYGYLVKPKSWLKIKFLTKYSILMVVCDMEYKFDDYIEKFDDFKKILKI